MLSAQNCAHSRRVIAIAVTQVRMSDFKKKGSIAQVSFSGGVLNTCFPAPISYGYRLICFIHLAVKAGSQYRCKRNAS